MPKLDLSELREKAEAEIDFEYVEQEGPTTLRFDTHAGTSIFAHDSGTIEGSGRAFVKLKAIADGMTK